MTQNDEHDPGSSQDWGLSPDSEPSMLILRYSIAAVIGGSVTLTLALLAVAPDQLERAGSAMVVFLVGLVARFFLRQGRARAAIYVLVVGLWACVTGIVVFTGGVRAPLAIIYPSIILVVGWLASWGDLLANFVGVGLGLWVARWCWR